MVIMINYLKGMDIMKNEIKDNNTKGNTINIGIVNNSAQANVETKCEVHNELKVGPIKLLQAWWGNKTIEYITNYNLKREMCINQINDAVNTKIPSEYFRNPRINIVGPALDNLKFNLDEEYIKELFTNLIVNEMDSRNKSKVLPAYVEIIKQLSIDDAILIKKLFNEKQSVFSIVETVLRKKEDPDIFIVLKRYISLMSDNFTFNMYVPPLETTIDNLDRLKIIRIIPYSARVSDREFNKNFFKEIILNDKEILEKRFDFKELNLDDFYYDYNESVLEITDFGYQFMEICLQ